MKQIIITGPFRENEQKAFCNLSPDLECKFVEPQEVTVQMLSKAQALIGNVPPSMLVDQPQLEWVQLTSSGADKYVEEKNISKGIGLPDAFLFSKRSLFYERWKHFKNLFMLFYH